MPIQYREKCLAQTQPNFMASNVQPVPLIDRPQSFAYSNVFLSMSTLTIEDYLKEHLSAIPQVTYVYLENMGDVLLVTVVIDNFTEDDVALVFKLQERTRKEFKSHDFDFDVVYQFGRPVHELISPMPEPLYQRA